MALRGAGLAPRSISVGGQVLVAGSDRGVPGLVVVAFDDQNGETVRLGSSVTDAQGAFAVSISPERALLSWLRTRHVNLSVVVLAPEKPTGENTVLFTSDVRVGSTGHEEFRISLPATVLESAGLPVPTAIKASAQSVVAAVEASKIRIDLIRKATDAVFESRFQTILTRRTMLRNDVMTRVRNEMSSVTDTERASGRFVDNDARIEEVQLAAVVTDVSMLTDKDPDPTSGVPFGKLRRPTRLLLDEQTATEIFGNANGSATLTEAELEQKVGKSLNKPAAVYRRQLEPDPCRPDPVDCCLSDDGSVPESEPEESDESEPDAEEPESDGDVDLVGDNVAFDKAALVAALFHRQSSPEDPVVFGRSTELESPLTAGGVADVINGVTLTPGPADVPAFYDFHDLQVAFEPVWQEALDDKFLDNVAQAYDEIVERGGEPAIGVINGILTAPGPRRFFDSILDGIFDISTAADSAVPALVVAAVSISLEEWLSLPRDAQVQLEELASLIADLRQQVLLALDPNNIPDVDVLNIGELIRAANTKESIALRAQIQLLTADAERIVAHGQRLLLEKEARTPFRPTHEVIDVLRQARTRAYPFRFFAASPRARSVNFGILVTYRQQWTPISYQVGELVSTVPLAPRETRRFSKRTVVKTKRSQQEVESNLISRRMESEERNRAEAEIVARATARTNFSVSKSGTVNIGEDAVGGSATTTSTFSRDAEKHSQSVKKEFREAILKSAEEYRNERKVEVSTEETFESEFTESGEIQNPNDEIPVTFLFYELQRRFEVCEKLHRLQSVVLVAHEVPSPGAVNADWLIRHDWILNRVLLDDSFRPALTYVSTSMISEDVALREMRQALFRQRQLVAELKEDVEDRRAQAGLRYAALQRQIERTAASADGGGGLFGGLGKIVGGIPVVGDLVQGGLDLLSGGGEPSEAAQIREGAARDAFERERREEEELASRIQNALSTLNSMQRDYTERLGQHLRELAQVERLSTHVVQNITHYMQAIWSHEPDDQRYLRLRSVPVPVFTKDKSARRYVIDPAVRRPLTDRLFITKRPFPAIVDVGILDSPLVPQKIATRPLSEVADIGRPLGFLGNYMIFPMLESNPITEFMMDPYVTMAEGEYGISDPDPLGNMTLDEFCEYVCCLRNHFDDEPDRFERLKPLLRETLKDLLQRSLREDKEVIVPSNNLYIEALPGAHSVMERFKHLHRQIDVKAAQEQLRRVAIDNVRRAQRILVSDLEDPDIEAKYVFEGDGSATVVPPPPPAGPNP